MDGYSKYITYRITRRGIVGVDYRGRSSYKNYRSEEKDLIDRGQYYVDRVIKDNGGKEISSATVAGPFSTYEEAKAECELVKQAFAGEDTVFSGVASDSQEEHNYQRSQSRQKEEWWTSQAQSQAAQDISDGRRQNGSYGSNWESVKSQKRQQYGL